MFDILLMLEKLHPACGDGSDLQTSAHHQLPNVYSLALTIIVFISGKKL